ncbi:MAG: hypothetical protein IIW71_09875 [Treponema sp.]|nr:hypothetical protein [Treponema sp.]
MKKLLSVFAAAAMLFGFASCSGDLHDDVYKVIDLSGGAVPGDWASPANWDNTTAWTTVDKASNTYTFDFETKADLDGDVGFKIVTVSGEWNVDGYTEFEVPVDGSVTAEMKTGAAMGGAGNAFVTGCKAGGKYTMTVVSNPDTTITVSVVASEGGAAPAAPVPFYLDGFYISGDMNGWVGTMDTLLWSPTLDKDTGILTYKYDFAATKEAHDFGIRNNTGDWKVKYVDGEFAFGTDSDFVAVVKHDDGKGTNNKITGLTKDSNYRIYVQTTPEKEVSFKVVVLNKATINVNVTGLPDEANGKVMYLTGDYFGWNEPGDGNSSIKGTVADGAVSYSFDYIYEGTTFELQVQGKAGSKGWTKPEISGPDGQNASFTVTHEKTTVTVTYVETKEITSTDTTTEKDWGLQYRCKWDVK